MAINLLDLTFTEQDDIVPESGEAQILNSNNGYSAVNTLAGNDRITGSGGNNYYDVLGYGFKNEGVLNTDDGDDVITGITVENFSSYSNSYGLVNEGTLNTGRGNDEIFGFGYYIDTGYYNGIYNSGTLNAGEGDDKITGYGNGEYGLFNNGTLNTEDGNDIITAIPQDNTVWELFNGLVNKGTLHTGEGNDTIIGRDSGGYAYYYGASTGILNFYDSTINTGNDEDSIISEGTFSNKGGVFLGHGNDSITSIFPYKRGLENYNFIGTGDGDDIITTTGVLYNEGIINTGNGDDSIIGDGYYDPLTGKLCSIYNDGGNINTGDGNDSIITANGFQAGENSSGAWFLGEGEDYIKGFGSGDFYGGNGNDTLELTAGTYTVGIWSEGGESLIFTAGDPLMITSQFETLIAGGITYNFASLTAGQIIVVA
jgi:hypothetical protein